MRWLVLASDLIKLLSFFTVPHRTKTLGDFNPGKIVRFFGQESDVNRQDNVTKYLAVSDAGHCKGSNSCGFPPLRRVPAIKSRFGPKTIPDLKSLGVARNSEGGGLRAVTAYETGFLRDHS